MRILKQFSRQKNVRNAIIYINISYSKFHFFKRVHENIFQVSILAFKYYRKPLCVEFLRKLAISIHLGIRYCVT